MCAQHIETRDFQKAKVYAWERKLALTFSVGPTLTLEECQLLVNRISQDHGHEPPTVFEGRGSSSAYYHHDKHAIKLPHWSRSRMIVCHEYAHSMHRGNQYKYPAHGWQFMDSYITLLSRYATAEVPLTLNELRGHAFSYGLCLR